VAEMDAPSLKGAEPQLGPGSRVLPSATSGPPLENSLELREK
jgi:hypothetical protein